VAVAAVETSKGTMAELEEHERSLVEDIERLEGEVGGLRADVAGLVLDAPNGRELKAAKEKLQKAAGRLQTAQEDLEHVRLAKVEWGRRETTRMAREERHRREAAVARAHKLQDDRDKAAKKIDGAFSAAVEALEDYFEACIAQRTAFDEAEMDTAAKASLPPGSFVEGAFIRAMRLSKVPLARLGVFDGLPPVNPRFCRPLAESDYDMRRHTLPREEAGDGQ
jgi:hypothetical protein